MRRRLENSQIPLHWKVFVELALIFLCSYIRGRTTYRNIFVKLRVPFQKTKIFGQKILSYIIPFVWHFNFWSYHTFTVTHVLYVCSKYFIYSFTFVFIYFLIIIYSIDPLLVFLIFYHGWRYRNENIRHFCLSCPHKYSTVHF